LIVKPLFAVVCSTARSIAAPVTPLTVVVRLVPESELETVVPALIALCKSRAVVATPFTVEVKLVPVRLNVLELIIDCNPEEMPLTVEVNPLIPLFAKRLVLIILAVPITPLVVLVKVLMPLLTKVLVVPEFIKG
jgi:hypothetical protein